MGQGTRPICAWCGLEGAYGFELVSNMGQIFQYTVDGALVFLHQRCEANYRYRYDMVPPLPEPAP